MPGKRQGNNGEQNWRSGVLYVQRIGNRVFGQCARQRAARAAVHGLIGFAVLCGNPSPSRSAAGEPRHGIAMHGEPALPAGFTELRYANPAAPKGGRLVHGILGTFDSLNPLIVKGLALNAMRGYVIESLMARGYDEPFTLY